MYGVTPTMKLCLQEAGKWDEFVRRMQTMEDRAYDDMRKQFDAASIERFANYENELPGHVFRYLSEDAFLGRRNLSKLFGKKTKRPARECEALEAFLDQLMEENGASLEDMKSVISFMVRMNLKARDLQFLWVECGRRGYKNGHPYIPRVEPQQQKGKWRLGWFVNGQRQTQWQEYTLEVDLLSGMNVFEGADEIAEVE